jgi:hypothetical protein
MLKQSGHVYSGFSWHVDDYNDTKQLSQ